MIETPHIIETAAQLTAVIKLVVPTAEIMNVMGPGIRELMSAVAAQGIGPAGPWFTHHFKRPSDVFDFEIGVPVTGTAIVTGRVEASQLPATKAARTVYHGGYEGLAGAWGEFEAWIAEQKLSPAEDLWEVYLVGPESGGEASTFRTALHRPLID